MEPVPVESPGTAWPGHQSIIGQTQRQTSVHTEIFTYGQFRAAGQLNLHVGGNWKLQTVHRKAPVENLFYFEAARLNTAPPCGFSLWLLRNCNLIVTNSEIAQLQFSELNGRFNLSLI